MHRISCTLALTWIALATAPARSEIVTSLDDITHQVGSGANRAGLVIDWGDGFSPVAWRFQWDGVATAEDLLRAVDTFDPRLVAAFGDFPGFGAFVDSLGYDRDGDGFSSNDPSDSFGDGDFVDFWEFFTAPTSPYDGSSTWTSSDNGISSTQLSNGNWIGLRFDPFFPGPGPGPVPAAIPEPSTALLLGGALIGTGAVRRFRRRGLAQ